MEGSIYSNVSFAGSYIDFNVQAGFIAASFVGCVLLITTVIMVIFGLCNINLSCGHCSDADCCGCGVIWTYFCLRYCRCCCRDFKRKMEKRVMKMKKELAKEDEEELRREEEEEEENIEMEVVTKNDGIKKHE